MFGGIRRTLKFMAACEEFGVNVWFKSPDAGVATAAQIHITAAVESVTEPSQTLLRWHADEVIAEGPFVPKDGEVPPPDGPGLGVTLDPVALARCAERYASEGSLDFRPRGAPVTASRAVSAAAVRSDAPVRGQGRDRHAAARAASARRPRRDSLPREPGSSWRMWRTRRASTSSPSIAYQHCDVASLADWQALASETVRQFGKIDVVHNNAYMVVIGPTHE